MRPASIPLRDWAIVVMGYTARLALFKSEHNGYTPAEWAAIQDADAGFLRDVRALAYETETGETP